MYTITFTPSNALLFSTVMSDLSKFRLLLTKSEDAGVCIDLSAVSQCDSAGLALLIEAKRLCALHDKSLVIEGMSNQVKALAEFCGVQALWSEV